ncbi:MAG: HNH endonuclease [Promethearchaeia archaeon]
MKKNKIVKKITKKELKRLEKKEINRKDKEWKLKIKERDDSKCQICGRTDIINCHHIFPREIKKLRWVEDNGICLCPKHHKFSLEISAHRNPLAFILFLIKNKKEQLNRLIKTYNLLNK